MVTTILLVLVLAAIVISYFGLKFKIIEKLPNGDLKINFKFIVFSILAIILVFIQPLAGERINAGSVGLIENLIGDVRGVGSVEYASGFQFYNKYTQRIHEIEVDIKPVDYGIVNIAVKGGNLCPVHPTFSVKLRPETAAMLFTDFRPTIKAGGLQAIISTWMKTAIMGGVNHAANKFQPDSIFNNQELFELANLEEARKRVGKYFDITQMRANIQPAPSLLRVIEDKAVSIQEAQKANLDALRAEARGKEKVAIAEADYNSAVFTAKAKEILSQPKMLELLKLENERIWAEKGVSMYGNNNTFLGSSMPNLMLNLKK